MKWHSIPYFFNGKNYYICRFTGSLICDAASGPENNILLTEKLRGILKLCDNPYLMPHFSFDAETRVQQSLTRAHYRIAQRIILLSRYNFFLARHYSGLRYPSFHNATAAFEYFNHKTRGMDQNLLCLPRSLFVSKTSIEFKNSGAVLIGVYLPSRMMHAWVIEGGAQQDKKDKIWHQFKPIAAIC
jgi:hypothetical protein